ncbi:MAG: YIP1 family protein [Verrucomicrobiota bacterium]|nr:YIP1 family protein [Verrucomicrobiota bacterium]
MEQIHLARGSSKLGIYNDTDIREGLASGRFLPTDLAWREGFTEWRRLGDWAEFAGVVPPELPIVEGGAVAGDGPPWEHRETLGFAPALLETIRAVLLEPTDTFKNMRRTGGIGNPLMFFLIIGGASTIAVFIYDAILRRAGFDMASVFGPSNVAYPPPVPSLLGTLIFMVLGTFVSSGVIHVCMMLVKGANHPFETTFRVWCYSNGAVATLNLIPVVGVLFVLVWICVVLPIGLMQAQETTLGKTVVALLLPMLLCCGAAAFVLAGVFALKASGGL